MHRVAELYPGAMHNHDLRSPYRWSALTTPVVMLFLLLVGFTALSAQTTRPEWRSVAPLPAPLTGHRVALLPTGDVLVVGGLSSDGSATTTSWIIPPHGAARPTANQLTQGRAFHALVAASTGGAARLFAIGGYEGGPGGYRPVASIEMLEQESGGGWRWRTIGALPLPAGDLRAAWDGARTIVVTGGFDAASGALHTGAMRRQSVAIDVLTLAITPTDPMRTPRAEGTAARYLTERGEWNVLVAGGEGGSATSTETRAGNGWDPIANRPLVHRSAGVGFGDPAGIARRFGGRDSLGLPLASCEWYDVKRGWRTAPRMNDARFRFDAVLVAGTGDTSLAYLAVAGDGGSPLASTEIFTLPTSSFPAGAWSSFPSLLEAGRDRQVAIDGENLPLVIGGGNVRNEPLAGVECFQPLAANDLEFGGVEVGRLSDSMVVTIENHWLLPVRVRSLRIDGSAEFLLRGDTADFTLKAGGKRTLRLYFRPAVAGRRQGRLLFDVGRLTDTVALGGEAIASSLTLLESPLDFGPLIVGSRTERCIALLRNDGTTPTTLDSIALPPGAPFRLASPRGRITVAAGDTLRACFEFAPDSSGAFSAAADLHIGGRLLPLQLLGTGRRRFGHVSPLVTGCDTISFEPGRVHLLRLRLENRGDTTLEVGLPSFTHSAPGAIRLVDSTLFPLAIEAHATREIELAYVPVREGREGVQVRFPNNGDTLMETTLCLVSRSRRLSFSQPQLDFGGVCIGDTVLTSLTLENPGVFDTVEVTSVATDGIDGVELLGFAPRSLAPREAMPLVIRYAPGVAGRQIGRLLVATSAGSVELEIAGEGMSSARLMPLDVAATVGDTVLIPVRLEAPVGTGLRSATVRIAYDPTLLLPLGFEAREGKVPVTASIVREAGGIAHLELRWATVADTGLVLHLRAEMLRSGAATTPLTISGSSPDGLCLRPAASRVTLSGRCGAGGGVMRAGELVASISPQPASRELRVALVTDQTVTVTLHDPLGNELLRRHATAADARDLRLDLSALPSGLHLLRITLERGGELTRTILVQR